MEPVMHRFPQFLLASMLSIFTTGAHSQCEADTTVYLTDFVFYAKCIYHFCRSNSRIHQCRGST